MYITLIKRAYHNVICKYVWQTDIKPYTQPSKYMYSHNNALINA
jgi:hypothetical protein